MTGKRWVVLTLWCGAACDQHLSQVMMTYRLSVMSAAARNDAMFDLDIVVIFGKCFRTLALGGVFTIHPSLVMCMMLIIFRPTGMYGPALVG